MIEINRKEVLRYLGYQKVEPDEIMLEMLEDCIDQINRAAHFSYNIQKFDIQFLSEDTLQIEEMIIHSKDLSKNLNGCHSAYLFAGTIGMDVDRLIRRAEITNMAKAMCYQAIGAACIEAYVDKINEEIIQKEAKHNMYCRPRFSPGYGDFSLSHQSDFSRILDMPKTCGINLTDTLLMVPSKSVTAVIGVTDKPIQYSSKCERCANYTTCEFSKKG